MAADAGFDMAGIALAAPLDSDSLDRWIDKGYCASMDWLVSSRDLRLDPRLVLPGTRSVISLAVNYFHPGSTELRGGGRISRFAWGRDYHKVLGTRLRAFRRAMEGAFPGLRIFAGVDAIPVMQKVWAAQSGLGWLGKNGLFITTEYGSWVFLATLLIDLELTPDRPVPDRCGDCSRCIQACPTGAIVSPGVVDARRCASFNTIESGELWSVEIAKRSGGWILGCDACQDACPFSSRNKQISTVDDFGPRQRLMNRGLDEIARLGEDEFELLSRGSTSRRAGLDLLKKSALTEARRVGKSGGV